MSAKGRGGSSEVVSSELYPTPAWAVDLILDRVKVEAVGSIMEPCKGLGEGSIFSRVLVCLSKTIEDPIKIHWCETLENPPKDYLSFDGDVAVDLTITNPPFSLAIPFLQKSLKYSQCVVYLLRLNFLASEERKSFFLESGLTHLYVLSRRPSFVDVCKGFPAYEVKGCKAKFQKNLSIKVCPKCGGSVGAGTDATDYAWFVWDRSVLGVMLDSPGVHWL